MGNVNVGRPVLLIDFKTGKMIQRFNSIGEVSRTIAKERFGEQAKNHDLRRMIHRILSPECSNKSYLGYSFKYETKKPIRKVNKNIARSVLQVNPKTGKIIQRFDSISKAAKHIAKERFGKHAEDHNLRGIISKILDPECSNRSCYGCFFIYGDEGLIEEEIIRKLFKKQKVKREKVKVIKVIKVRKTNDARPILMFNINGIFEEEFKSVLETIDCTGIKPSVLREILNGKREKHFNHTFIAKDQIPPFISLDVVKTSPLYVRGLINHRGLGASVTTPTASVAFKNSVNSLRHIDLADRSSKKHPEDR